MPLDPDKAADIAAEHGLDLSDVPALRVLADNEDDARRLAAKFSKSREAGRELADRIYNRNQL